MSYSQMWNIKFLLISQFIFEVRNPKLNNDFCRHSGKKKSTVSCYPGFRTFQDCKVAISPFLRQRQLGIKCPSILKPPKPAPELKNVIYIIVLCFPHDFSDHSCRKKWKILKSQNPHLQDIAHRL